MQFAEVKALWPGPERLGPPTPTQSIMKLPGERSHSWFPRRYAMRRKMTPITELELVLSDWECVMPRDQEDSTSGLAAVQKCECGHLRLAHELENGCRVSDCSCEGFLATAERAEDE